VERLLLCCFDITKRIIEPPFEGKIRFHAKVTRTKQVIQVFIFYFAYVKIVYQTVGKTAVLSTNAERPRQDKGTLREGFLCFCKHIFYLLIQHGVDVPDCGLFFRRRSESEPSE
jgi:hypothetical protein